MNLEAIQAAMPPKGSTAGCSSITIGATRWLIAFSVFRRPASRRGAGITSIPAERRAARPGASIEAHALDGLPGRNDLVLELGGAGRRALADLLAGCGESPCSIRPSARFLTWRWWTRGRSNWCAPAASKWSARPIWCSISKRAGRRSSSNLTSKPAGAWIEIRGEAFDLVSAKLRARRTVDGVRIKGFIRDGFDEAGLVTDHGPIVGVNGNASNPHYEPQGGQSARRFAAATVLHGHVGEAGPARTASTTTSRGRVSAAPTPPAKIAKVFGIVTRGAGRAPSRLVQERVAARQQLRGFEVDDAARATSRARLRRVFLPPHRPFHRRPRYTAPARTWTTSKRTTSGG